MAAARGRADAYASGNCSAFKRYVTAGYRYIDGEGFETLEAELDECRQIKSQTWFDQRRFLSQFHFRFLGRVALVDFVVNVIETSGDVTLRHTLHQTDTFVERDAKWFAVLAVGVPIVNDPPAIPVTAASYDALTGKYQWVGAPAVADIVTRRAGRLFVRTTGDEAGTELFPLGGDTFYEHGSSDRFIFIRDHLGRVVEEYDKSPDDRSSVHAKRIGDVDWSPPLPSR